MRVVESIVLQRSGFTDGLRKSPTSDRATQIGNGAEFMGMDELRGISTPSHPEWPGWGKAACFLALGVAAWASLILPAIYLFE